MMRNLVLIVLLLSSAFVFGQNSPVIKDGKKVDTRPKIKSYSSPWRVGGGLGLNMGSNDYFGVSVAPYIGYRLTEYMEAGLTTGYQYASTKHVKQHLFHGGPLLNFFPIPEFFGRLQYEHYMGSSKLKSTGNSSHRSENALWIGAGYHNPGPVSFYGGIMYNLLYRSDSHFFSNGFRPIAGVSVRL